MRRRHTGLLTRRAALRGGALLAAPALMRLDRALAGETVVYVSAGGTTQEAQEKTILATFEKETGIHVISIAGADLAKMKAQQMAGNVQWDVINLQGAQAVFAATHDMLEKIDYSVVDSSDMFMPTDESTIPWYVFTGGIGYRTQPDAPKHPTDWQQFFNAKTFPGRRGLRARPDETLEPALLGDGVPARQLYPLDVDRAFRSLERLRPNVTKWIPETQQTITLMQTSEVDFDYAYNGRIELAKQRGIAVDFVYSANIVTPSYLCVLKGTRHRVAAMKLANYFLRPDLQAAFCNMMGYSPIKRSAMKLLTPATLAQQPKMDDPNTAVINVHWWADNFEQVNKRFKEWLLS